MNFRFETGLNARLAPVAAPSGQDFALGQPVDPSDPETYARVCTGGWSGVEWDGVWSDGAVASLRVLLAPDSLGPLAIWATVKPFNPHGHVQIVHVRCDGVDMGQAALHADSDAPLVLQIVQGGPASARSHVRLEIAFPSRLSPAAAGLSDDRRELGFQLQALVVTASTAPAPPSFEGEAIRFEPATLSGRSATPFGQDRSEPSWGPTLELLVRQLAQSDRPQDDGWRARLETAVAALHVRLEDLAEDSRRSRRLLDLMHDQLTVAVRRSDDLLLQSCELVRRGVVPLGADAVACRTPHGHVLADPQDPAALLVLADTGDLEPGARTFFERFVEPGMQVVDAGANLGVHTLALARLVGPDGCVHAFEPAPRNVALLRRTLALNGVEGRTRVHATALGDQAGSATLHLGARGGLHSLYPLPDSTDALPVQVETLDQVLAGGPPLDLLKADVEGAEIAILNGAADVIGRSPDLVIVAEYAPSHLARAGLSQDAWFAAFEALGLDRVFALAEPSGACRPFSPADEVAEDGEASLNLVFARSSSARLARIAAIES